MDAARASGGEEAGEEERAPGDDGDAAELETEVRRYSIVSSECEFLKLGNSKERVHPIRFLSETGAVYHQVKYPPPERQDRRWDFSFFGPAGTTAVYVYKTINRYTRYERDECMLVFWYLKTTCILLF